MDERIDVLVGLFSFDALYMTQNYAINNIVKLVEWRHKQRHKKIPT
jgi:hypothetical protein